MAEGAPSSADEIKVTNSDIALEITLKYFSQNFVPLREALRKEGFDVDNPELIEQPGSVTALSGIVASKQGFAVAIEPSARKLIVLASNETHPDEGVGSVVRACETAGYSLGELVAAIGFNATIVISGGRKPSGTMANVGVDRVAALGRTLLGNDFKPMGIRFANDVDSFNKPDKPHMSFSLEVFLADPSKFFAQINYVGRDLQDALGRLKEIEDISVRLVRGLDFP